LIRIHLDGSIHRSYITGVTLTLPQTHMGKGLPVVLVRTRLQV
jgi:hypothetical protein